MTDTIPVVITATGRRGNALTSVCLFVCKITKTLGGFFMKFGEYV